MTNKFFKVLSLMAIGVSIVSTVLCQQSNPISAAGDSYVISARAGGVNYAEGSVVIARREGRSGQLLKGDEVQVGDVVSTGADGRAEILLNPGSFVRIDKNTDISFVSTSLDDLRIKLSSGSAIFEVIADDDFKVSVRSPKSKIELIRSGVYRIDVSAEGGVTLGVWKGTAFVGSAKTEVKAGRAATVNGDSTVVAKFDRDQKDDLDTWSKSRAKELAKVNAGLQRKVLRNSLLSSFNRSWNMYDSFGLWIFDPGRRFWCFMPFGYGWGSPYGFGYDYDFWTIGMPRWIYFQPPWPGPGSPSTGGSPTAGNTPPKNGVLPPDNGDTHGRIRQPAKDVPGASVDENVRGGGRVPPFVKIENNQRVSGEGVVDRRIDIPRGPDFSSPGSPGSGRTAPPMPSAPPPASAPPPTISIPKGGVSAPRGKPDN